MKKFNYIASAKRTFKIESDAIKSLSSQLDNNFEHLCDVGVNFENCLEFRSQVFDICWIF